MHSMEHLAKSTVAEIRERFDADVERFSNLETGQTAAIDAAVAMDLIARAAAATNPHATCVLDIGCGAGNYSLKLQQHLPQLDFTIVDLSQNMLDRATERIIAAGQTIKAKPTNVCAIASDIRDLELPDQSHDIILAAAVLHHLRSENQWRSVFEKLYRILTPGGSFWIFDLVESDIPAAESIMRDQYARYLIEFRGEQYRDEVFAYIAKEDTPRSVTFQLQLMQQVGFRKLDVLHKTSCFAAFGGMK